MPEFTHFDESGNAIMVDVAEKKETSRQATASGRIKMSPECFDAVRGGKLKKGDVLSVARIAGIMAAKQAPSFIPLCHTLLIEKAAVDFIYDADHYEIEAVCSVKSTGRTGVEMEALTGVTVALLTIYDMCKAMGHNMEINGVCLIEKSGGKSGVYKKEMT